MNLQSLFNNPLGNDFPSNLALLAIVAVGIVLFLWNIILSSRINRLQRQYHKVFKNSTAHDFEELLLSHLDEVRSFAGRVNELEKLGDELYHFLGPCVQRIGVVRFNAFDDIGSDLSFSVALLDRNGDGVIFSSLYGRNESRSYAKPVKNGKSTYKLSEEEEEAIKVALREESGKRRRGF